MAPNAYIDIGANSPLALNALLDLDDALRNGMLSAKDAEVVKLAASQVSDCEYCLGAHTLLGKKAGLSKEEILAARHGHPSGNARINNTALDFPKAD